mmetsp:Transcript_22705/g.86035  ORF Transcript_22705/g.86035 Transcript_22705/m.86035 type:complete len:274 (-) Transcript_22705:648-1469(-)
MTFSNRMAVRRRSHTRASRPLRSRIQSTMMPHAQLMGRCFSLPGASHSARKSSFSGGLSSGSSPAAPGRSLGSGAPSGPLGCGRPVVSSIMMMSRRVLSMKYPVCISACRMRTRSVTRPSSSSRSSSSCAVSPSLALSASSSSSSSSSPLPSPPSPWPPPPPAPALGDEDPSDIRPDFSATSSNRLSSSERSWSSTCLAAAPFASMNLANSRQSLITRQSATQSSCSRAPGSSFHFFSTSSSTPCEYPDTSTHTTPSSRCTSSEQWLPAAWSR